MFEEDKEKRMKKQRGRRERVALVTRHFPSCQLRRNFVPRRPEFHPPLLTLTLTLTFKLHLRPVSYLIFASTLLAVLVQHHDTCPGTALAISLRPYLAPAPSIGVNARHARPMSSGLSTAALAPAAPSTKRLSTIAKASGSGGSAVASPAGKGKGPANGGAGLAKDVVSPGELCGFVSRLLFTTAGTSLRVDTPRTMRSTSHVL
jgi:hypothetical protein